MKTIPFRGSRADLGTVVHFASGGPYFFGGSEGGECPPFDLGDTLPLRIPLFLKGLREQNENYPVPRVTGGPRDGRSFCFRRALFFRGFRGGGVSPLSQPQECREVEGQGGEEDGAGEGGGDDGARGGEAGVGAGE